MPLDDRRPTPASLECHQSVIIPCTLDGPAVDIATTATSNLADLREEGGATTMRKALKMSLIALMALGASWTATAAHAGDDVANASATNVQVGDNENSTEQSGSASSGDAVAGQVAGVVSSGDASVDATNRSEDVDVSTG